MSRRKNLTPKIDYRSTIVFDAETWAQVHEMGSDNVSALIRKLVRKQYKQQQKEQQGAITVV